MISNLKFALTLQIFSSSLLCAGDWCFINRLNNKLVLFKPSCMTFVNSWKEALWSIKRTMSFLYCWTRLDVVVRLIGVHSYTEKHNCDLSSNWAVQGTLEQSLERSMPSSRNWSKSRAGANPFCWYAYLNYIVIGGKIMSENATSTQMKPCKASLLC